MDHAHGAPKQRWVPTAGKAIIHLLLTSPSFACTDSFPNQRSINPGAVFMACGPSLVRALELTLLLDFNRRALKSRNLFTNLVCNIIRAEKYF